MKTRVVGDVLATEKLCQELGDKNCALLWVLLTQERFSHGDNFEKLGLSKRNAVVYSLRLNKEKRVLLTRKKESAGYRWIVLDYLPHHEYHSSRFLQSQYLAHYLQNLPMLISISGQDSKMDADTKLVASTSIAATASTAMATGLSVTAIASTASITTTPKTITTTATTTSSDVKRVSSYSVPAATSSSRSEEAVEDIIPQELYCFNQELIILNNEQEQALLMSEPMLLTGMPGSGKSCVALNYLMECLCRTDVSMPYLLYVAESELLVKQIAKSFHASSLGQTPAAKQILFLSYDDLLRKEFPEIEHLKRVGKAEFSEWFDGLQRNDLIDLKTQLGTKTAELVYQELRMMSGMDYKEYQSMGERSSPLWNVERISEVDTKRNAKGKKNKDARGSSSISVVSVKDKKEILRGLMCKIKEDYCAHLDKNRQYDSSFFDVLSKVKTRYSHIAVDEAQDFSTLQLRMLYGLALRGQKGPLAAFFGDSHQSIEDNFPKHHFFKTILGITNIGVLPGTYRCSKAVIDVANTVLSMKYHVTGGLMEKGGQGFVGESAVSSVGQVRYLPDKLADQDKATQAHVSQLTNSPWCAVITLEPLVKEAQSRFPGAIVLTPKQAKGLEYDAIILYGMLQNPRYIEINKQLQDFVKDDTKASVHRAKASESNYEYNALINGLFTAITRARYDLYMLLPSQGKELHCIKNLVDILKRTSSQTVATPETNPVRVATREDWQEEIRQQIESGNRSVALNIAQYHFGINEIQFNAQFPDDRKVSGDSKSLLETKKDYKSGMVDTKKHTDKKIKLVSMSAASAVSSSSAAASKISVDTVMTPAMQAVFFASDNKVFHPMMNFLKQPGFLKQLFCDDMGLSRTFYDVISPNKQDTLWQVLTGCFKKHDEIAKQFTLDALCETYVSKLSMSKRSCLSELILAGSKGVALLDCLLQHYKKEWVSSPVFWNALCMKEDTTNNNSIYELCCTDEGRALLGNLVAHYPGILNNKEFIAALCLPLSAAAGASANTSGLSWLCCVPAGLAVLHKWVSHNPEMVKNEKFIAALCLPLFAATGVSANTSSLYGICCSPDGRAVLDKWVSHNPEMVKNEKFIAALCLPLPAAAGDGANASVLYVLCLNSDGRALLDKWVSHNPEMVKNEKFIAALCLSRPAGAGVFADISGLYGLCSNHDGRAVLHKWVSHNPNMVKNEKFIAALCLPLSSAAGAGANTSGLAWLCCVPEGLAVLHKWVSHNPEMVKNEKFITALCLPLTGVKDNPSPLLQLQSTSDGLALIIKIVEMNPSLLSKVSFDAILGVESAASIQKTQEHRFFGAKRLSAASGVECDTAATDVKAAIATAASVSSAAVAVASYSADGGVIPADQMLVMGVAKK